VNEDFWIGQIHALRVLIESMRAALILPKAAREELDAALYSVNAAENRVREHAKREAGRAG
jgi:hypothetical protein